MQNCQLHESLELKVNETKTKINNNRTVLTTVIASFTRLTAKGSKTPRADPVVELVPKVWNWLDLVVHPQD